MASASVTITFTDTANHPLATVRDKLLIKWNYSGGGGINWVPLGTAQDKLNFIQKYTAKNWFKEQYIEVLQIESQNTNATADVDIQ